MNKYKNGKDRKDNFITTFKIDADLEKFYRNVPMIYLVESIKAHIPLERMTLQDYLNTLIRNDMLNFLKEKNISTIDEYFEINNIKGDGDISIR